MSACTERTYTKEKIWISANICFLNSPTKQRASKLSVTFKEVLELKLTWQLELIMYLLIFTISQLSSVFLIRHTYCSYFDYCGNGITMDHAVTLGGKRIDGNEWASLPKQIDSNCTFMLNSLCHWLGSLRTQCSTCFDTKVSYQNTNF